MAEQHPESVLVSLARIEGKLDLANQQLGDVHQTVGDHETRLRVLEASTVTKASARWWFSAVVALVVAACTVVALVIQ